MDQPNDEISCSNQMILKFPTKEWFLEKKNENQKERVNNERAHSILADNKAPKIEK